ncbi:MAG: AIR synthase related protein [Planctomycetota bacterium]
MRENDLLQHIYAANPGLATAFPGVTIPPGDDMGAIEFGGRTLLVAADQVINRVHFDLTRTPLEKIGRKAITRNLSDVAAMAARPAAAVAAVALPRGFGHDRAAALFDAMRLTGESFGCPLIGGDTAIHDGPLSISVTVLAEPWDGVEPVRRRGEDMQQLPRVGDAIYVTGELGNSFATGHHLDFTPRLELAKFLAENPATRPTAMMDLSDGLAQDLPRLVAHAELQARVLPVREGTPEPRWHHAIGDGEDYELLFTAAADAPIPDAFGEDDDAVLITRVGTVTDAGGIVVITPENQRVRLEDSGAGGWEHTS